MFDTIFSVLVDHGPTVFAAMGGASLLAAILPRPAAGSRLETAYKVLDVAAANWAAARNAR